MGVHVHGMLRQALGSVKDHALIGKAMIYNRDGYPEIEIAIVRATMHDDSPIDDKYMHEILFLVSNSPGSIAFLAERLSQRLGKTRDRIVALKTLVLIHRLLRGGNRRFEQQLCSTHVSGHLQLHPKWISGSPNIASLSFLHNYSTYLEERMQWKINQAGKLEPILTQVMNFQCYEEKQIDMIFRKLPKCQDFIDKVLEFFTLDILCSDSLTRAAMTNILKESFQVYTKSCEGIAVLLNMFFDFTSSAQTLACEILKKASWQSEKLNDLYDNCKQIIGNKHLEYPFVQVITVDHVMALEQCLSYVPTKCKIPSLDKKVPTVFPLSTKLEVTTESKMGITGKEEKSDINLSSNFFSCTLETKINKVWVVFEDDTIISV